MLDVSSGGAEEEVIVGEWIKATGAIASRGSREPLDVCTSYLTRKERRTTDIGVNTNALEHALTNAHSRTADNDKCTNQPRLCTC